MEEFNKHAWEKVVTELIIILIEFLIYGGSLIICAKTKQWMIKRLEVMLDVYLPRKVVEWRQHEKTTYKRKCLLFTNEPKDRHKKWHPRICLFYSSKLRWEIETYWKFPTHRFYFIGRCLRVSLRFTMHNPLYFRVQACILL